MTKYLLNRILRSIFSIICVVAIVMLLIYTAMDRNLIFASDATYRNLGNNQKIVYKYRKWQEYGYIYYVTYADYLNELVANGEMTEEQKQKVVSIARKAENDSEEVASYVKAFREHYEAQGYEIQRLDAVMMSPKKYAAGGQQQLFAAKDRPVLARLGTYFTKLIKTESIHYVDDAIDIGQRGLTFTLRDPAYGGEKISPAIMGNGTFHKYLLWFDAKFPYIHQNIYNLQLGASYTVNMGVDVFTTMTQSQGSYVASTVTYPSGLTEESADDLHSATYVQDSLNTSAVYADRYTDDYTSVSTVKRNMSKMGYSFSIGIIATMMAYLLGMPLGITMALKKDKLVDKLGTIYIVFILAVPSLAYIFLFKAIGGKIGLPTTFDMESSSKLMFILPIVSLALPSVAGLMKWLRRYMIDQMNSDYVKFARSGGLSEGEIFSKHILKNAMIPVVHGIPADILFAMTGAIITERVYVVPGAGNMLTQAINTYDNGVIVGMTLFYAVLTVTSLILGDILMSLVDPRISFTTKDR